jgi:Ca2+/H+ antiporter, TMEM165/GDT1 family
VTAARLPGQRRCLVIGLSSPAHPHPGVHLEAFLVSTGIVALAEIGDKTQLLALCLAARFRRPWPIVWGILAATLANHGLAAGLGQWVTTLVGPEVMRWILAASFIAMALWMLVPDELDADETPTAGHALGVFGATLVAFFLAEMADKTQVATVALAARFDSYVQVVAGTTLGMLLANVPVVFFGDRITAWVPTRVVHGIAAGTFVLLGVLALIGAGG